MNTNSEKPDRPIKQGLSITEAALRLGVSERTVYRMLREGKLQRLVSDNIGRNVRLDDASIGAKGGNPYAVVSENMSDNNSGYLIEALRQELREKDDQIVKLIEHQREMTAALQRLQDQMFELARLTLSQNAIIKPDSSSQPLSSAEAPVRRWRWPWRQRGSSS